MNYRIHKGTGVPVILLHGWGGSMASFEYYEKVLIGLNNTVINLDLWGFGSSEYPPTNYGIHEYSRDVSNLLDKLAYKEYYVIGHSFGGRVAILLGSNPKVKKLVLIDSAGLRPRRKLSYYIRIAAYKIRKKLGIKTSNAGSSDYKALAQQMKPVFVRIVNTHLNRYVKTIKASTLIIWGKHDVDTPLYMANYLKKHIVDSGLIVFDAGHYSYLENYKKFIIIVNKFFGLA